GGGRGCAGVAEAGRDPKVRGVHGATSNGVAGSSSPSSFATVRRRTTRLLRCGRRGQHSSREFVPYHGFFGCGKSPSVGGLVSRSAAETRREPAPSRRTIPVAPVRRSSVAGARRHRSRERREQSIAWWAVYQVQ